MNNADWFSSSATWRLLGLRFIPIFAVLNVIWEIAQLPFYTLGRNESVGDIAFAVAHCTLGDVLIGVSVLALALIVTRSKAPATWSLLWLTIVTTFIGTAYTIFSEWMNTRWLDAWAYSSLMPTLPLLGTGLTPLLQWLVVPGVALKLALPIAGRGD